MIRQATEEDLVSVYKLINELEQDTLDFSCFRKIYEDLMNRPDYHSILWEEDTTVMGFLNLRTDYQLHHAAKIAEIVELIVNSGQRSKGIGKQLFNKACELARDNKCVLLELSCNEKRINAHKFYENCGMIKSHFRFTIDL